MELVFLGTGAGMPSKMRNVTSIALKMLENSGAIWLFDCGEATQHQILSTALKPRRIEKIFITHLHGDHIFGLPGLLSSRSFQGGDEKVVVYGPKGIKDFILISLKTSETYLKYKLEIIEIDEGIIFEDDEFIVEAKVLDHRIKSFGFRVVEKDRPGALLVDKLKEAGIKPGPIYKKIKSGENVVDDDGTVIVASNYLGEKQAGRILTILGDTKKCQASIELAEDADLLVHEATFSADEGGLAKDYHHSTTAEAAEVAKVAKAKKLCLTHISSRYEKSEWKVLLKEAQQIFPNTYIAEDFKQFEIPLKK